MSSVEDSHAKTSAPQGRELESPENAPACGPRWPGSLARYDPDTRSWRTARCSLFGGLEPFSETWPRWGMMLDGESFPLPTPAHLISGNESGFWLTPVKNEERAEQYTLETSFRHYQSGRQTHLSQRARDERMFPTPTVQDAKNNGAPSQMQRNTKPLNAEIGGALNPTWVEWLMGWPLEWTALQPLGMDKFRQWLHSHGGC